MNELNIASLPSPDREGELKFGIALPFMVGCVAILRDVERGTLSVGTMIFGCGVALTYLTYMRYELAKRRLNEKGELVRADQSKSSPQEHFIKKVS